MSSTIAVPRVARVDSVDLVRGVIMVVMALDHVRDYFHFSALEGLDPTDLSTTTPAVFLTRWITHYCAPVFCFLAGTGAFFSVARGKSKREQSWFLVSRGLWLVFLEVTVVGWFGWSWDIDLRTYNLLVLWALGCSMIVLAGLIHLPFGITSALGLGLILFHNAADGIEPESLGSWAWLWHILHVPGAIEPAPGYSVYVLYPLVPWIGVMAAGYGFGALLREPSARPRRLLWLGASLSLAFLVLRGSNLYGDPEPWARQDTAFYSFLSLLNCQKYPPSLSFLLMTLGPTILLIALFDRGVPAFMKPIQTFGRVPMFYYLLHIPLIHALAYLLAAWQVGRAHSFLIAGNPAPPGGGVSLGGTYLVWLIVVAILYPLCRWFAALKQRRRDAWLSYF